MDRISLIAPNMNKNRVGQIQERIKRLFYGKCDYEIIIFYKQNEEMDKISNFRFEKVDEKTTFDEQITKGFELSTGNVTMIADLNDPSWEEYSKNMLDKYFEGTDIVYVRYQKEKTNIFGKIGKFFKSIWYSIVNIIGGFFGLAKDLHVEDGFQLFNEDFTNLIKAMPEKNCYVRNFNCWADAEKTILHTDKKIKTEKNIRLWNDRFFAGILLLSIFPVYLLLIIIFYNPLKTLGINYTFLVLGLTLMCVVLYFGVYLTFRSYANYKMGIKEKEIINSQQEEEKLGIIPRYILKRLQREEENKKSVDVKQFIKTKEISEIKGLNTKKSETKVNYANKPILQNKENLANKTTLIKNPKLENKPEEDLQKAKNPAKIKKPVDKIDKAQK